MALFDDVVGVLAPDLGANMARSSVELHLTKAGVARERLAPEHLAALVERVKPGLAVFVGRARADALGAKVLALATQGDRS